MSAQSLSSPLWGEVPPSYGDGRDLSRALQRSPSVAEDRATQATLAAMQPKRQPETGEGIDR
jgi:hypothetical protein